MALVTPADLNLFESVRLYRSTIHWACIGLMSESLADTLAFEGSVPRASRADTCFENQLLYFLEINALASLLTDRSKGWNLCRTMTTLQKFPSRNSFRISLSWLLNVFNITKEYCFFGMHFSSLTFSKYGNTIYMKTPQILRYWNSDFL